MSEKNHYGKSGWIATIIVSIIITFIATLTFTQSVWSYNQNANAESPTTNPATQPTTQPRSTADGKIAGVGSFDGTSDVDHSAFNDLLQAHVSDERIDYAALKGGPERQKLDAYLDMMADVDVQRLSEAERLAYWINLYNASMIEVVLMDYPIENIKEDLSMAVFKKPFIDGPSGKMSLDDVEHETIRKQWDEPRIHAALVCGAISCPPLVSTAFTAENVDQMLEQNFTAWITNGQRNQFDHDARTAQLSGILNWYVADFGGDEAAMLAYINDFIEQDITGYNVEYVTYDWTLNDAK